jgi:hypothetical protein
MLDEGTLRTKAREAIAMGRLPSRHPSRMSAGNGFGTPCAVCGGTLNPDEVGYELEFPRDGDGDDGKAEYHVHLRCFAAWELERHIPPSPGIESPEPGSEAASGESGLRK